MRSRLIAILIVFIVPTATLACLWDSETLKQERARFPSVLELITGKFLRHSKEFYEWRIEDRQKKLKSDPNNMGYYDDIAVGYQKIGQPEKAIETIRAKEEIEPGLYETYSNLGTFCILAGDFEKGLPYIDKALAINPDAHFGREKYQKWLVEYAMARMKDGKLSFPLGTLANDSSNGPPANFADLLAKQKGVSELSADDSQSAIKGVLGMMRFANHDNPLLLEALGDLLLAAPDSPELAARLLAARAFLKASYVVDEPSAKGAYRNRAEMALVSQVSPRSLALDQLPLQDVEADFKQELADADQWYAALKQRELDWIREGKDVEAEFDKLYAEEPTAMSVPQTVVERIVASPVRTVTYVGIAAAVVGILAVAVWRGVQKRQLIRGLKPSAK